MLADVDPAGEGEDEEKHSQASDSGGWEEGLEVRWLARRSSLEESV